MQSYLNPKLPAIVLNTPDIKTNIFKKVLFYSAIILIIIAILISAVVINNTRKDYNSIPSLKNSITNYYGKESSVIVDREGKIIFDYRQRSKKEPVDAKDMPELMKYALLVREDENYYNASGFSWKNFAGALFGCTKSKITRVESDCRGGSGIYQQLVKNFDNTATRDVDTKYLELLRSLKASEEINLDDALMIYLNNMDFGRLSKGVQIGSRSYFNHPVNDPKLNPAQACFLAIMPNQPTGYTTATRNMLKGEGDIDPRPTFKWTLVKNIVNSCITKLATVRVRPEKAPIITEKEAEDWIRYDITKDITREIFDANEQAKHYIKDYIEEELLTRFNETFADRSSLENFLYNKKLTIKTTFDSTIQNNLEQIVLNKSATLANDNINQLASAVVDNKTSELLALQGNLDYSKSQINRLTGQYGYILPGSSTKPYYFAGAFERGFNPGTMLQDGQYIDPVIGNVRSNDVVGKYQGNVSMRYGLQQSINTVAEQAMYLNQDGTDFAFKRGVNNSREFAQKLGLQYQENDETKTCLSSILVAIGNCYVQGLSHLNSMATLANKGIYNEIRPLISVKIDNKDLISPANINFKYASNIAAIQEDIANQTMNVLSDYATRRDKNGSRSNDASNYEIDNWTGDNQVAAKSGTAQIWYDNKNTTGELSVIGASNKYSTLLWAANIDEKGTKLPTKVSASGITPIYREIVTSIHKDIKPEGFSKNGLIPTTLDPKTGLLATTGITELLTINQVNILKGVVVNPRSDIFVNRTGVIAQNGCYTELSLFNNFRFDELKNYMNSTFNTCNNTASIPRVNN
jgi:membrane peptidoglycan carboxypeptidase